MLENRYQNKYKVTRIPTLATFYSDKSFFFFPLPKLNASHVGLLKSLLQGSIVVSPPLSDLAFILGLFSSLTFLFFLSLLFILFLSFHLATWASHPFSHPLFSLFSIPLFSFPFLLRPAFHILFSQFSLFFSFNSILFLSFYLATWASFNILYLTLFLFLFSTFHSILFLSFNLATWAFSLPFLPSLLFLSLNLTCFPFPFPFSYFYLFYVPTTSFPWATCTSFFFIYDLSYSSSLPSLKNTRYLPLLAFTILVTRSRAYNLFHMIVITHSRSLPR